MTGVMRAQIDWPPLSLGGVRPAQGKTLAVIQVSGGSQSFNAVNQMRMLRPLDSHGDGPEPLFGDESLG